MEVVYWYQIVSHQCAGVTCLSPYHRLLCCAGGTLNSNMCKMLSRDQWYEISQNV